MKYDVFNNTRYLVESMLDKSDDPTARALFDSYFKNALIPQFYDTYGIKVKLNENYSQIIKELDKIRPKL